jgi:hypothetical protein
MAKFKFNWGHGVILALVCFIVFITSLVFFAGNMGEMVEDNYYEKTIHYQNDINAANRANELKHKPELIFQANGILLKFHQKPQSGEILFLRPNNSEEDIRQPLKLNSRNEQLIHALDLIDGDYEVSIRWKQDGRDYLIKKSINWKSPFS